MIRFAAAACLVVSPAWAEGIKVDDATVPLAPPGVMAHAAYMTLTNTGTKPRQLVSISADGYAMAHLHKSETAGDVATMSSLDLIEIAPGQSIAFEYGGLHIMLMRPSAEMAVGGTVSISLEFADGETVPVNATVTQYGG